MKQLKIQELKPLDEWRNGKHGTSVNQSPLGFMANIYNDQSDRQQKLNNDQVIEEPVLHSSLE